MKLRGRRIDPLTRAPVPSHRAFILNGRTYDVSTISYLCAAGKGAVDPIDLTPVHKSTLQDIKTMCKQLGIRVKRRMCEYKANRHQEHIEEYQLNEVLSVMNSHDTHNMFDHNLANTAISLLGSLYTKDNKHGKYMHRIVIDHLETNCPDGRSRYAQSIKNTTALLPHTKPAVYFSGNFFEGR